MIMLDTNHCLSYEPSPPGSPPMGEDMEKAGLTLDQDRLVYLSLKEVLQLKLQQRRTREELVSQGIMPPLKSPAAFHEQRRSLERARTEDYLKRKIRSRPERSELVRMHILEETSAEPSLQAKQLQLKRARLADDLNDKISHRPGPIELVHKNILSVDLPVGSPLGEGSSLDEDSCDALSPDQLTNQDSPLSAVPQLSPSDLLSNSGDMSPTQVNGSDSSPFTKVTNGTMVTLTNTRLTGHIKSQNKSSSDRPPQRPKKPKDSKPKVKKLKYHQYIPPDQKADKERPPQMDSSYAKLLHQQQLFLQLQILNQQQQHYNYHTILPAPPKPPTEQPPSTNSGPSPSRSVSTTTTTTSNQSAASRLSQSAAGGAKPGSLPANLDEFKVAELKQELKLRGLTVSGTKNDLIERLRNYQEQNGGNAAALKNAVSQTNQQTGTITASPNTTSTPDHHPGEGGFKLDLSSIGQVIPGRVMRFGSTSSSPPMSPTPSERSLAGMSPDETSCNGDMFGEMVSSPLTQLTLHPSPQHPSNVSSLSTVKEESLSSCRLSSTSASPPADPLSTAAAAMDTSSVEKDQMLQEKDKQIEELTRMLRQKQRLVETLRSQLEQGKVTGGAEKGGNRTEVKLQTLIKASAIQPPTLPNGMLVKVKKELEPEEGMEGVTEGKKAVQPMQCSQETLLRLQQIHRLQIQQAEHNKLTLQPKQKTSEVTPVFVNQQNGSQVQTQAISLDLLKANGTPTLVTDSNGNHYLIALTNHSAEGQNGGSSLAKPNSRITLQRLQSTPTKLPSTDSQSKEPPEAEPIKKVQKAGLHLDTNVSPQPSLSAPPSLQPFFDDIEEVCYDRHTLFTPPSPKHNSSLSSKRSKQENGVNSQQMDDLFDILLKSGEIPGFKGHPDPSLAPLHSDPPSPASPPSPLLLHLSPPSPPSPLASPPSSSSSARLEDFLESSTGNPLLGVEPDGGLTLIHDLHSQMLSTSSILDPHAPSPMDTSDLGFSPHPAGLDFDSMDWLDISMVRGGSGGGSNGGEETSLAPLVPHTPPSVFSTDFLDGSDLQLHWESCL
ncbi:Myocardin-related transcription factor A [Dissostichus eleginoides]|uniref:Myocardin-related transcription factor A n=1 Tax=Dissostichus eleginoides TaxID=100907 RepID=A0AAD9BC53_DISEL|nr:Myocardin-related transcription factor A [Dissostichus eleginoides]